MKKERKNGMNMFATITKSMTTHTSLIWIILLQRFLTAAFLSNHSSLLPPSILHLLFSNLPFTFFILLHVYAMNSFHHTLRKVRFLSFSSNTCGPCVFNYFYNLLVSIHLGSDDGKHFLHVSKMTGLLSARIKILPKLDRDNH